MPADIYLLYDTQSLIKSQRKKKPALHTQRRFQAYEIS
jgi:hypothetical protein